MAFESIPDALINVGKAVKKRLFQLTKDNFDDHESRINGLESGAGKIQVFNFEVMGFINNYTVQELVQIGTFRAPSNLILTEVKLTLLNGSSSPSTSPEGVLSIDVQKSIDNGLNWNSILAQQPQIADSINATGAESDDVIFITNGEDVLQDELLRVNVTSKKDIQGSFLITVYGDVA